MIFNSLFSLMMKRNVDVFAHQFMKLFTLSVFPLPRFKEDANSFKKGLLKHGWTVEPPRYVEGTQWVGHSNRHHSHVPRHDSFIIKRQIHHHLEADQGNERFHFLVNSLGTSFTATSRYLSGWVLPRCAPPNWEGTQSLCLWHHSLFSSFVSGWVILRCSPQGAQGTRSLCLWHCPVFWWTVRSFRLLGLHAKTLGLGAGMARE